MSPTFPVQYTINLGSIKLLCAHQAPLLLALDATDGRWLRLFFLSTSEPNARAPTVRHVTVPLPWP
ncbi:hypothetical protein EON65_55160 [archaeon]|nr:MAG: hypothetical protein EON65_55160 [archaeon]